jgi:hypothetical protein
MKTVYSLRDDPAVQSMQAASQSEENVGLVETHGLIGSPEWWAHIEDGSLAVVTTVGEVIHFFPGHHGDWPEIEVRERDGSSSSWGCNIPADEAAKWFVLGRSVEVDHVQQELKVPFNGSTTTCLVTGIRIDA